MLDTIVETAASICKAELADIAIIEGENIHIRASFGELGRPMGQVVSLDRSTVMGRAVLEKHAVHVADVQAPEMTSTKAARWQASMDVAPLSACR